MASTDHDSHDSHDAEHEHDHPLWPHVVNLLALFALTALTYGVSLVHLGAWSDIVALSIALVKATLVIMIFMHVKEATRLVKVAAVGGFFWIFLFFAYLVGDVLTRPGETVYEGWEGDVRKELSPLAGQHHGEGDSAAAEHGAPDAAGHEGTSESGGGH